VSLRIEIQTRLREELSISKDQKHPYLDAIIYESLRLVTTIESYQPRVVPQGGRIICSHFVPEGTLVSIEPSLINLHPDIFPEPEYFKPDRWMIQGNNFPSQIFTFSSGPRSCVAKDFATESKFKISHLIASDINSNLKKLSGSLQLLYTEDSRPQLRHRTPP
jgi:cytochrome P450